MKSSSSGNSAATFAIFAKQPIAGEVKTRLAASLGEEQAAAISAAFLADLVDRFRLMGARRFLCHAPATDASRDYFRALGRDDYDLWPQPAGDLGQRLAQFFDDRFRASDERVVVIGADSPTLPREFVERAFERLEDADVVLGPATDGGFYLVGQRAPGKAIFEAIEWSSPRTLGQTVDGIKRAGARLALLPPWYDVDTPEAVHMLRGHVEALRLAGGARDLPATAAALGLRIGPDVRSL
ncbi:MAG: TIGR04282 family arsenosugar biosynthesis glycosyltransferase [Planctomycetaceae bacterium]